MNVFFLVSIPLAYNVSCFIHLYSFQNSIKTSTNQTPEGVHLPSESLSRVAIFHCESVSRVAFCPLRMLAGWQSISHPFLVSELVEVFPAAHRRWLNIIRRGEILLPPNSGHLGFELSGIRQNAPFCFFQVI